MKKTPNFSLSQWEFSDRIRMEDFNNDNLQMDNTLQELTESIAAETAARKSAVSAEASARTAAVQTETAARTAAIAALEQRSTTQVIKTVTLTEDTSSYLLSFAGIDWTKWLEVILLIESTATASYRVLLNSNSIGSGGKRCMMLFFPLYNPDSNLQGFWVGQSYPSIGGAVPYKNAALSLAGDTNHSIPAGTKFTFYGRP